MMVERACEMLGVNFRHFEFVGAGSVPNEEMHATMAEIGELLDGGEHGVICLHLHGSLNDNPRFGTLETLNFGRSQLDLLRRCFTAPTVLTGTSLSESSNDHAARLLDALRGEDLPEDQRTDLWVLNHSVDEVWHPWRESPAATALEYRRSHGNFVA